MYTIYIDAIEILYVHVIDILMLIRGKSFAGKKCDVAAAGSRRVPERNCADIDIIQ